MEEYFFEVFIVKSNTSSCLKNTVHFIARSSKLFPTDLFIHSIRNRLSQIKIALTSAAENSLSASDNLLLSKSLNAFINNSTIESVNTIFKLFEV